MSRGIDPRAAAGFTAGVDAYVRGRPSYPPDVLACLATELGLEAGRRVLDLAAGTGKMTTLLAAVGVDVAAVEPVAAMRERLHVAAPYVQTVGGTAEAIPLRGAAFDAVVVAQAFHWFRPSEALAEIARVLRPDGGLALVWNSRDRSVPWVARVNEIIRWNAGEIPTFDAGDEWWADVVAVSGHFTSVRERHFRHEHVVDEATFVDRVASTSYIAAMDDHDRATVLDEVRGVVSGFPDRFPLPYRTDVYTCRRLTS